MYTKAVTKARFAEAFANLKAISQADIACQLEKGDWCKMEDLSIEIPGVLINDGNSSETDNFIYTASGNPDTPEAVQALYKKEDVCICIFQTGELTLWQEGECIEKEASFDYNKLFNIEQRNSAGHNCLCC